MSTKEERKYIRVVLIPEIKQEFELKAKEYQQERDLGFLGEFSNLYRKARKLKTLVWPGQNGYIGQEWREDKRTIVMEVVMHGILMLVDLAKESKEFDRWLIEDEEDELEESGNLLSAEELKESKERRERVAARQFGVSTKDLFGG